MNRVKSWIRALLGFSRTETNAFIILLPLVFLIIFHQPIYQAWVTHQPQDYSKEKLQLDSLVATWQWEKKDSLIAKVKEFTFYRFDPNTASKQAFDSLGLNSKVANRIINYRKSGGRFKVKSDLKKIYGMDSIWFKSAFAYIDLPIAIVIENKPTEKATSKKNSVTKFDLNKADTTQLIGIYGIGTKLATRIIKYRQKLGGFIEFHQLKEVYGLDSTVIFRLEEKTFIDSNFTPVALHLNQLTEKELASHPYLNWKIAKAITAYRFQHGHFKSLDDLTQLKLIDEQTLQRVKPYLTLD